MARKKLTKREIQLRSAIKIVVEKSKTGALRDVYKRLLHKRPALTQDHFQATIQDMRSRGDLCQTSYGRYQTSRRDASAAATAPTPAKLAPKLTTELARAQAEILPVLREAAGMGPDLQLPTAAPGRTGRKSLHVDEELIERLLKDRSYKQIAIVDSAILNLKLKVTVEVV